MILYRGEAIRHGHPERVGTLRSTIRDGFATEFIQGGNPYLLAKLGLFDAAIHHVANNFNIQGKRHLKHFISFSEDRETAIKYAHGISAPPEYIEEVSIAGYYRDITSELTAGGYDFENDWPDIEHLIVSIDDDGAVPIQAGFSYGLIKTYNCGNSKILLLNSANYFDLQVTRMGRHVTDDVKQAAENATRDKEWLVLVLDLIPDQPHAPPSASGIVRHGDPLTIETCLLSN